MRVTFGWIGPKWMQKNNRHTEDGAGGGSNDPSSRVTFFFFPPNECALSIREQQWEDVKGILLELGSYCFWCVIPSLERIRARVLIAWNRTIFWACVFLCDINNSASDLYILKLAGLKVTKIEWNSSPRARPKRGRVNAELFTLTLVNKFLPFFFFKLELHVTFSPGYIFPVDS